MKINNHAYGGFTVSKNLLNGKSIQYSFREKSSINALNGWNFYAIGDDDDYVNNPNNFEILTAESVYKISPLIIELFEAPYGTDLYWLYKEDVHIGFYDLKTNKEVTIEEILGE